MVCHPCVRQLFVRPEVCEVTAGPLRPLGVSGEYSESVVRIGRFEIATAIGIAFRLALRTIALEGIGAGWCRVATLFDGGEKVILATIRLAGERRLRWNGPAAGLDTAPVR